MLALRPALPPARPVASARRRPDRASRPARSSDRELQVWLDTGILTVGSAWVPPAGFRFRDRAEAVNHVFLFPRGCLWVHGLDRPFVADATTVVRHRPWHTYASAHPGLSARVDWFAFAPQVLRELGVDWSTPEGPGLDHGSCGSRDYRLQRLALLEASLGDSLAEEESLLRLVAGILERSRRAVAAPSWSRHGTRVVSLVERTRLAMALGLEDAPSLDRLGREVSTSIFHLCRTFKRVTGTTVHRYLTELRLRAALDLVAVPRSSLASIAADLSFATHSHFSAAFRGAFGEAPSAFRQRVWADRPLRGIVEHELEGSGSRGGAIRRGGHEAPPTLRAHALQRAARRGSASRSTAAKRLW